MLDQAKNFGTQLDSAPDYKDGNIDGVAETAHRFRDLDQRELPMTQRNEGKNTERGQFEG